LVGISVAVVGVSLLVLALEPLVVRLVSRTLFKGSFNYQEDIRKLAAQILEDTTIGDPLGFTIQYLKKCVGITAVKFESTVPRKTSKSTLPVATLLVPLRITRVNSGALLFGPKNNGDLWSRSDERILLWLTRTTQTMLRLDFERQEAKKSIENLRGESLGQMAALKNLNVQLSKRDDSHARRLDQLAHDLRNPITYMHMSLEDAEWDNQMVDQQIIKHVRWLNKFVGHVLELSRAEAGKNQLEERPVNLAEILYDLALTDKRIRVAIHEDVAINGDDMLLLRAFSLLISQALLISKERVTVSLKRQSDNVLAIVSSKPNETIDIVQLKRSGSQFGELLANHTTRNLGLTGLELHICRWVAEAHRGRLDIAVQGGQLTISLVLPIDLS
jgi:signal transduction histidine kinase